MKILKNIWMILNLDCEASAQLTSDSFDRKLTLAERVAVRLHCLFCSKSRKLRRQLIAMNEKLMQMVDSSEDFPALKLSEDARERIYRRLSDQPSDG